MRVYSDFFWYPNPDQRFLKWIRIRNTEIQSMDLSALLSSPIDNDDMLHGSTTVKILTGTTVINVACRNKKLVFLTDIFAHGIG